MTRGNRFFIWEARAERPTEFDPYSRSAAGHLRYYYNLACELDRALRDEGLRFLFTWHLDEFEDRLRDAVVFLIGDEKYQTPSYARAVRAIFKTGGTRRNPAESLFHMAPAVAWRVALRDLRNTLFAGWSTATCRGPKAPLFELPIGYYGLREVTWVPFQERTTDVFFAGSAGSAWGFTVRPKVTARRQMLRSLASASDQLSGLRVDCTTSGPFGNPEGMLDPETYSGHLMNARIALCPRGNIDETFRVVEAARLGCVAVVERLPPRWYNVDSPVVQIDRWSSLPKLLRALLSDSDSLARRSDQMYRWWMERLSEQAVARFVVAALAKCSAMS